MGRRALSIRWLGRVGYEEAWALQRGLHESSEGDHLLLLEHPHVFTYGPRSRPEHLPVAPTAPAKLIRTDRGGDVTYHGPGQLVGYPILSLSGIRQSGFVATSAYVRALEELLIGALEDLGLSDVGRLDRYQGVWKEPTNPLPRKLAALGVRVRRGRTLHGFSLNVDPDLSWFDRIVPCGIRLPVTSLASEGLKATMRDVVDAVAARAADRWGQGGWNRADVAWSRYLIPTRRSALAEKSGGTGLGGNGRSACAGSSGKTADAVSGGDSARKPQWLRVVAHTTPEFRRLRALMRRNELVTVCEEAGCPNIYECWSEGTATFMICGERCTRSCGFCLVDTRRPEPLRAEEPEMVADAVSTMGLSHAVITAVARDDLPDGGADHFVSTIRAVRRKCPGVSVEVLVPDFKGDGKALSAVTEERPDVLNHNLETVARLQRRVRPSAGYARSLALLARAAETGLITKSSLMVGLGESFPEVCEAMADLAGVGCSILTIGQYLQPSSAHLQVERWWEPFEFDRLAEIGHSLGFAHVESSPLTRSSYHAAGAARRAAANGRSARSGSDSPVEWEGRRLESQLSIS